LLNSANSILTTIYKDVKCQTNSYPRKLRLIGGASAIARSVKLGTMGTAPIPGVEGQKRMTKKRSRVLSRASVFSCVAVFAPTAGIEIEIPQRYTRLWQ
jgi:hypothetical protein